MNKKQYVLTLILATLASLVGGALSGRFFAAPLAAAPKKIPYTEIFAAEKFFLRDPEGQIRAGLVFDQLPEGSPSLVLFDKDGRVRAEMKLLSNGTPGLTLYKEVSRTGTSSPKLLLEKGRPLVGLMVKPMAKSVPLDLEIAKQGRLAGKLR